MSRYFKILAINILIIFSILGALNYLPPLAMNSYAEFLKFKSEFRSVSKKDFMDSNGLCLNVLALSPSNLIMVDGFDDTKKRLEDAGCNVVTFDGSELCIKAEGGPTCLTRPIYRS